MLLDITERRERCRGKIVLQFDSDGRSEIVLGAIQIKFDWTGRRNLKQFSEHGRG